MTVTVEWTQQVGANYTVKVSPLAPIMFPGSASQQLTIIISYNTEYNLSVVAAIPCGNVSASITLNHGEVNMD